ncbi:MAG: DUF763 domain-containing protein [Candidatus Methanosuratincola subterraneus]|nr:MAG: DUF763 domain-containing protein [Candidatus Methanosuratincola subterraneus]
MPRTGTAQLPLHGGWAPHWLVSRMKSLARGIVLIMVDEFGKDELLRRLSDPFWFQSLGCVLGFDWHSSGVTTVTTSVLKSAIVPEETGIAICGGKGRHSRETLDEISLLGDKFGLSTAKIESLKHASRMGAKVDTAAIQAGYALYHHCFVFTEDGKWIIVQQGLNAEKKMARRFHWASESMGSFVVEPHKAIVGIDEGTVLNMVARESEGCRAASVDLAREPPGKLRNSIVTLRDPLQKTLGEWTGERMLIMPWNINWKAMERAYNSQPKNYEELLGLEGIGPSTVKGLALVSELIYGEAPSWKDPVKYSFAFGGKDGVPFPVRRKEMDEAIEILRLAVESAKLGERERQGALRRLSELERSGLRPGSAP